MFREVFGDDDVTRERIAMAIAAFERTLISRNSPLDRFLDGAVEVDVDAVSDGRTVVIAGVMQHIEEAGVHSGDSTCVLPPHTLSQNTIDEIMTATKAMAVELAPHGIRVNAIAPGVIVTSGTKQYPPSLLDNAEKANPLKRLGTAEEVSHLITYVASRYADFVAGQTFYIDGGASIWGEQWFIPDDVPKYPPYPVPGRD